MIMVIVMVMVMVNLRIGMDMGMMLEKLVVRKKIGNWSMVDFSFMPN